VMHSVRRGASRPVTSRGDGRRRSGRRPPARRYPSSVRRGGGIRREAPECAGGTPHLHSRSSACSGGGLPVAAGSCSGGLPVAATTRSNPGSRPLAHPLVGECTETAITQRFASTRRHPPRRVCRNRRHIAVRVHSPRHPCASARKPALHPTGAAALRAAGRVGGGEGGGRRLDVLDRHLDSR
jgi:hypothetical protein